MTKWLHRVLLKRTKLTLKVYSLRPVRLLQFVASNRCITLKSTLG